MFAKTTNPTARRLLALVALGWLNLILQPCFAAAPAMPAGMQNCAHESAGHSGTSGVPCLEMQADQCVAATDLNADAPRAAESSPAGALLLVQPPAPLIRAVARDHALAGTAAGPPLIIRYCVLRN